MISWQVKRRASGEGEGEPPPPLMPLVSPPNVLDMNTGRLYNGGVQIIQFARCKMAYEKPKTFKVTGAVPLPINEEIDRWAATAGMSKSQFVSVCIQLGLRSWIRSYAPESLLTPEEWAVIAKLSEKGE